MTCSVCGDSLNGTYFTFLNKLICERDYNVSVPELANIDARYLLYLQYLLLQSVQKTCSECGCRISDVYYTLDSGKVVCEADYRVTYSNILHCISLTTLGRKPWTSARSAPDLWRASW